ncbi:hypothetical protein HPB48_006397 [Haemaphysalis longicornis]|uniref:Uncharacterized protein n=1 Tax=Haemaphysalis longicornis TaxID=44386 RepID=A0A9J6FKF8_HAELO|nr:hypothetical protein HPB48_006397 [Haemaphysalis longicornis]
MRETAACARAHGWRSRVTQLEGSLHNMLDRVPHHLQEPLQGLLQVDPRRRPNAQNFSMSSFTPITCPAKSTSVPKLLPCSKFSRSPRVAMLHHTCEPTTVLRPTADPIRKRRKNFEKYAVQATDISHGVRPEAKAYSDGKKRPTKPLLTLGRIGPPASLFFASKRPRSLEPCQLNIRGR